MMPEEVRRRRSIRLPDYDYSLPGAYFVTICAEGRQSILGTVSNEGFVPNDAGIMIRQIWEEIPVHYPSVLTDEFIVMPNHVHGIIMLTDDYRVVGAAPRGRPEAGEIDQPGALQEGQPRGVAPTPLSLPDIIHRFKSLTTARYRQGVKSLGWPRFDDRLWQRNYWEHIIRNEDSLARIRFYIRNNPALWKSDRENPDRAGDDELDRWIAEEGKGGIPS